MRGLYRVDDGEDEEYLGASVEQETVGLQRKKKDGPAVGMAVATDTWRPQSQEEAASQRIVEVSRVRALGLGWLILCTRLFVYAQSEFTV